MEQHGTERSAAGRIPRSTDGPGAAWCWLLASLSLGAGVIHLVMVPQHAAESVRVGLAFAAAGWFQAVVGVALVAWPRGRRPLLLVAIAANLGFIAVWALSRTVGLPAWTGDGGVEAVDTVDLVCVAFEAAFVVCGVLALVVRPAPAGARPPMILAGLASVAVLAGTTVVLASPETAQHAHGETEASSDHAEDHADLAATDTATHAADDAAADAAADGHAHADSTVMYADLPADVRSEVDQVIALWANRYPTAADAAADGWFRATRSLYGIGAHFVRGSGFSATATFDMLEPNILLFDGEGPDARFAGVSYVVGGAVPEGFTGDFDTWHGHESVCHMGGSVVSLSEDDSGIWLSDADCTARGGRVLPLAADQMMHLWIGPDYIDHGPIFAHDHPWLYGGFNPQRDT